MNKSQPGARDACRHAMLAYVAKRLKRDIIRGSVRNFGIGGRGRSDAQTHELCIQFTTAQWRVGDAVRGSSTASYGGGC